MKLLKTCANAAEADLFHSVLVSAGIDAEVRDSRADITGVAGTQLFVADEQHAQAIALLATQTRTEQAPEGAAAHPAAGFPFLGIMGLSAIVFGLAYVVNAAASFDPEFWKKQGLGDAVLLFLYGGGFALLWGLWVGAIVALVCLIAKVTWNKLRA